MKEKMLMMWDDILKMDKEKPYVFRTRLNRAILKTEKYGREFHRAESLKLCGRIREKMNCISDQSNHNSDGELRSYLVLKDDIVELRGSL